MSVRADGRRFLRELRRSRRARLLAHQTIAHMGVGWSRWGGMVGGHAVTGRTRRDVEQQINRYYNSAIAARVLRRSPTT